MANRFISFSAVVADCYLLAGCDGSGPWLACLFVWWVCTGKRWEMLQPWVLLLPWVATDLYPTLFLYGEFPGGTVHFLVPQRSSERCHPCQALPGRVGTGGAHRDPRSVRRMLFYPAWLFAFHVSQENLLMAIFRKYKEGQMMEAWGFFYTNSSDIFQATLDYGCQWFVGWQVQKLGNTDSVSLLLPLSNSYQGEQFIF